MKSTLKLEIRAGKATLQPPIGPILGQYGIQGAKFCQDFNDQTKIYDDNIILSVKINMFKKKVVNLSWSPNISKLLQRLSYPIRLTSTLNKLPIVDSSISLTDVNQFSNKLINYTKIVKFKLLIKFKRNFKKLVSKSKKKKQQIFVFNYIYIEDIYYLRLRFQKNTKKDINKIIKEILGSLTSMQVYIIRK